MGEPTDIDGTRNKRCHQRSILYTFLGVLTSSFAVSRRFSCKKGCFAYDLAQNSPDYSIFGVPGETADFPNRCRRLSTACSMRA